MAKRYAEQKELARGDLLPGDSVSKCRVKSYVMGEERVCGLPAVAADESGRYCSQHWRLKNEAKEQEKVVTARSKAWLLENGVIAEGASVAENIRSMARKVKEFGGVAFRSEKNVDWARKVLLKKEDGDNISPIVLQFSTEALRNAGEGVCDDDH